MDYLHHEMLMDQLFLLGEQIDSLRTLNLYYQLILIGIITTWGVVNLLTGNK